MYTVVYRFIYWDGPLSKCSPLAWGRQLQHTNLYSALIGGLAVSHSTVPTLKFSTWVRTNREQSLHKWFLENYNVFLPSPLITDHHKKCLGKRDLQNPPHPKHLTIHDVRQIHHKSTSKTQHKRQSKKQIIAPKPPRNSMCAYPTPILSHKENLGIKKRCDSAAAKIGNKRRGVGQTFAPRVPEPARRGDERAQSAERSEQANR